MTVRSADPALRDAYVEVYRNARRFMATHGNTEQWADKDFSNEVDLDLADGVLYEGRNEAGELLGVFAFLEGPDPTYAEIEGVWLDNAPYCVLRDRVGGDNLSPSADRHPPRQPPDAASAHRRRLLGARDHSPV